MDGLGSLWTYQESIEELKHKLLCTTVELDTVKMEAKERMRKSEEYVKSLIDLLKVAHKERDEARDQLQKILGKINPIPNPSHELPNFPHLNPESPWLFTAATTATTTANNNRANSSITESNSLGSSPVDSLLDAAAVSSPEFSNFNVSDSAFARRQFAQESADPAALVIENLAKKRALPQKGKLLQAVMEAGPLLQTLLVAGPLPRWRNPPPLQPFRIPPVSIKGAESSPVLDLAVNSNSMFSQSCSSSMLNFGGVIVGGGGGCSSGLNNTKMLVMSSGFGNQIPIGKRQRLH